METKQCKMCEYYIQHYGLGKKDCFGYTVGIARCRGQNERCLMLRLVRILSPEKLTKKPSPARNILVKNF